jgi:hypothetical protein
MIYIYDIIYTYYTIYIYKTLRDSKAFECFFQRTGATVGYGESLGLLGAMEGLDFCGLGQGPRPPQMP